MPLLTTRKVALLCVWALSIVWTYHVGYLAAHRADDGGAAAPARWTASAGLHRLQRGIAQLPFVQHTSSAALNGTAPPWDLRAPPPASELLGLGLNDTAPPTSTRPPAPAAPAPPPPAHARPPHALEQAPGGGAREIVWVDWPMPAAHFTVLNYRAFESVLGVYPRAKHRPLVVGPANALMYKYANALAHSQFNKYRKLLADPKIHVDLVDDLNLGVRVTGVSGGAKGSPNDAVAFAGTGADYWGRHGPGCAPHRMTHHEFQTVQDSRVTSAVQNFIRLHKLWKNGGLYVGFLTPMLRGFGGAHHTRDGDVVVDIPPAHGGAANACTHGEMLLRFSKRNDPLLGCVLERYEAAFLAPACRQAWTPLSPKAAKEAVRDPASAADNEAQRRADAGVAGACLQRLVDTCVGKDPRASALRERTVPGNAVEWFNCSAETALRNLRLPVALADAERSLSLTAARAGATPVAYWLGPEAARIEWVEPAPGSLVDHALRTLCEACGRMTVPAHAACRPKCSHFTVPNNGTTEHPHDVGAAKAHCAPSFIIPGTQKGASTFLFHALAKHPQVVSPLRGAHGFKEAGAYLLNGRCKRAPYMLGDRIRRFPFLEPHENLVTGDGTVRYMVGCKETPEEIKRDNPHAKIVFALRDPVARAWSDYRFASTFFVPKGLTFTGVVDGTLAGYEACYHGLADPERPESLEAGVARFYDGGPCPTNRSDPHNLIRKGMYYYQVKHWIDVLGKDNVMVVTSEDLHRDQHGWMAKVVAFIGLCPHDFKNLRDDHVTPYSVPKAYAMTQRHFDALQAFYRPLNQALYDLLGTDFGWEKTKMGSVVKAWQAS